MKGVGTRLVGALWGGIATLADEVSIDGDRVVARVQAEAGAFMVKRYHLVPPGEE